MSAAGRPLLALLLSLLAALLPGVPAAARTATAELTAQPIAPAADSLPVGETRLTHGAIVYRPANGQAPYPLLVALHGAGGSAADMVRPLREAADRRGFLLLSLQSQERSWDLIAALGRTHALRPQPRFGADVARTDAVLRDLFGRVSVDPRRIVLGGFSDGASYALSLGTANPRLFGGVLALSPGFVVLPDRIDPAQRLFVAHGRADAVLPFAQGEAIVRLLEQSGADVRLRPFDGGHQMSRSAVDEGLAFTLGD